MQDGNEQTIGALRQLIWGRGRVVERLTGYDVSNHTQCVPEALSSCVSVCGCASNCAVTCATVCHVYVVGTEQLVDTDLYQQASALRCVLFSRALKKLF